MVLCFYIKDYFIFLIINSHSYIEDIETKDKLKYSCKYDFDCIYIHIIKRETLRTNFSNVFLYEIELNMR